MKIICTRQNEDGSFDDVGTNNKFLTSHYKTVQGFIRYGIPETYRKRNLRIEIYHDHNFYIAPPCRTIYHVSR